MSRQSVRKPSRTSRTSSTPKPRSQLIFKRTDIVRAARAAKDAKLPVDRIEIAKDGAIIIHTRKVEADAPEGAL